MCGKLHAAINCWPQKCYIWRRSSPWNLVTHRTWCFRQTNVTLNGFQVLTNIRNIDQKVVCNSYIEIKVIEESCFSIFSFSLQSYSSNILLFPGIQEKQFSKSWHQLVYFCYQSGTNRIRCKESTGRIVRMVSHNSAFHAKLCYFVCTWTSTKDL